MRLAQEKIVEASGKPTTMLLSMLPKRGLVALPGPAASPQKPASAPVVSPRPVAAPFAPLSIATFQEKYADRSQAMAMAYRSGSFTLKEIAEHFGVPSTAVKRAAEQYAGR